MVESVRALAASTIHDDSVYDGGGGASGGGTGGSGIVMVRYRYQ